MGPEQIMTAFYRNWNICCAHCINHLSKHKPNSLWSFLTTLDCNKNRVWLAWDCTIYAETEKSSACLKKPSWEVFTWNLVDHYKQHNLVLLMKQKHWGHRTACLSHCNKIQCRFINLLNRDPFELWRALMKSRCSELRYGGVLNKQRFVTKDDNSLENCFLSRADCNQGG